MKDLNYILQGFGYFDFHDFQTTILKGFYVSNYKPMVFLSITLGTVRSFVEGVMGLDIFVILVFVFLIIAEWQTGIRADLVKRNSKFKSRKLGRMILKIGVYNGILLMLYTFSSKTKSIDFIGFDINPMGWLYYMVFVAIVFQLVISYFENLGVLGYKEAKGISGIVLRRYNKWFEFDGEKDGDVFDNNNKKE
jgi:hypothetical protein